MRSRTQNGFLVVERTYQDKGGIIMAGKYIIILTLISDKTEQMVLYEEVIGKKKGDELR